MPNNEQPQSNDNTESPNPYQQGRNHEDTGPMDREDVLAVAGLLGTVNGALGEIDKRNVGGSNQFVQARKMDPKQTLKNIASANGVTPFQQPPIQPSDQHSTPTHLPPLQSVPPVQGQYQPVGKESIEKRIRDLEVIVESYKKIEKFKRGIGYSVSTSKIKGEFKDPVTILDLISTEIAKNTKTITLRLIDATTESKK